MKAGDIISICPECRSVVRPTFKEREIERGVYDVGVVCPKCGAFVHSYYLDNELKALQKEQATRQERRLYELKFRRLNNRLRKKYRKMKATDNGFHSS